eukprot:TRINITY_DN35117_c0_g1_i1.p1 TRINITY_DN35117_c0_g1~~TRINITY_DN35117_c0_g1_i1.p1  ORF type:complete len:262 (-),score=52.02 TRINITY_DN35117_c0_g1_i1:172-957(-)
MFGTDGQGGVPGGGNMMGPSTMGGHMEQGLVGGQAVSGIEKTMKWKLFFFAGACIVFATGVTTVLYWILHFTWGPATFMSEIFLLVFGLLMMVLDFPVPHPNETLVAIRDHCYKFLLFMTRFMGRGMWYLFLATLVFGALWDTKINWFFGATFSLYLILLGAGALAKGYFISTQLDKVRLALLREHDTGGNIEHYLSSSQKGLTKAQFKAMVENVTGEKDLFTDDDLDYVINALSFLPSSDGMVSREELLYWVRPGLMLMV